MKSYDNMPPGEFKSEYENEQPKVHIKWSAGPRQGVPVYLKPYDEMYIAFTILDCSPGYGILYHFDKSQVRTSTANQSPAADTLPRIQYLFDIDPATKRPIDIKKEVFKGDIRFSLRVAGKSVEIQESMIQPWKAVLNKDWTTESPTTLFERQFANY